MAADEDLDPDAPRPPWTRVAAYAVCRDGDDRILLVRLSRAFKRAGWWTLPGGGLELGETPEAGALRELTEETGLSGLIERLLGVDSEHLPDGAVDYRGEIHSIRIVYLARVTGELRDELDGSSDRAGWFRRDEIAGMPVVELVDFALPLLDEVP